MEILKSVNQLNDVLIKIFSLEENSELNDKLKQGYLIGSHITDHESSILADSIIQTLDAKTTGNLCDMLFQLNNYIPLLCNLTNIFLKAKKFDEIYSMVRRVFVAHVGNIVYRSTTQCSFSERYFDRFVEIIKNCKISEEVYMPFLIEIFKSDKEGSYCEWRRPALEYLQNFWNTNENWMLDFIAKNPTYRYGVLSTILQFNTSKGVELLIKDYFANGSTDLEQILNLVKLYKREVLFFIDTETAQTNEEEQIKLIELMLKLDFDTEIMLRLKDILSSTQNPRIRTLISTKMGLSETFNIRSEKQFLNAVRKHSFPIQERTLGVPFDKFHLKFISGLPADNYVYSFLIFIFKEERNLVNLKKLSVLGKIFEERGLQEFVSRLFDINATKEDTREAKWVLRMSCILGDSSLDKKILDLIVLLCKNKKYKEAKYLISCFIHSEKMEIIDTLKSLLEIKNPFIVDNIEDFITAISNTSKIEKDDIRDMLVLNFFSDYDYEKQRKRLFEAFIAGKQYTPKTFKRLFIDNSLFNAMAQSLVFGEYRLGRLYNAFIVKDKEIEFVIGKTIFEEGNDEEISLKNSDITISIIHPLDCDFKFENIFTLYPNPIFKQFTRPRFNIKDFNNSTYIIKRFAGVFINPKPFLDYMLNFGWQINRDESETKIKSLVFIMQSINLICEVELENQIDENSPYACLGDVSFYKLNDTFRVGEKYITQKNNALNVSALPYRYFDYILSSILEASKQK